MSKLYQQNKNRLMKLQRKINTVSKKVSIPGNSRICLANNTEYYGVNVDLTFLSTFEDFIWEELDGKLYLLAKVSIKWEEVSDTILFNNIRSRMWRILNTGSYYWEKSDEDVLEDLESRLNRTSQILFDMISHKKNDFDNLMLSSGIYHQVKIGVSQALSHNIVMGVNKRLYPRVKDRSRVPVLIYDAETDRIDHIGQNVEYSGSEALNPTKVRDNILFDHFSDANARNSLYYIPLDRWVEAYIPEESEVTRYQIPLHFSTYRYN